jgi:hypothetical protein
VTGGAFTFVRALAELAAMRIFDMAIEASVMSYGLFEVAPLVTGRACNA